MITEQARAKINLTLDILGLRDDGYHEVEMILQSIALADQLSLERDDSRDIRLEIVSSNVEGGELLPLDDKNLAVKAARIFFDEFDLDGGLSIRLTKNIPIAAGLAGGSADAAAVIRGINRLFDLRLPSEQLCKLGEQIGSDVPFCIIGGTCLATGRGERLTQLPDLPSIPIVLIKPRGAVPTAWAYKNYDADPSSDHPDTRAIIDAIKLGDVEAVGELMFNVLERISVKLHPSIVEYKSKLLEGGATSAVMSGSGPTIFGFTRSIEDAKKIAASIGDSDSQIFITETAGKNHVE